MIPGAAALRDRNHERGAVLVEFAFVAVILVLIVAGSFDYGVAWKKGLAVNEGARAGARVGSGLGTEEDADFSLLSSTKATLDSAGILDQVERVVIYRSDEEDGAVPPTCTTGTSGPCTILSGEDLRDLPEEADEALVSSGSGCLKSRYVIKRTWCPTSRDDVQLTADYLGVWIQVRHDYTFKLLGDSVTIERDAVMRLEPPED